jgi:hypothetical protein
MYRVFTCFSQRIRKIHNYSQTIRTLFANCSQTIRADSHKFANYSQLFATIRTIRVKKPQKCSACGGLYIYSHNCSQLFANYSQMFTYECAHYSHKFANYSQSSHQFTTPL